MKRRAGMLPGTFQYLQYFKSQPSDTCTLVLIWLPGGIWVLLTYCPELALSVSTILSYVHNKTLHSDDPMDPMICNPNTSGRLVVD